VSDISPATVLSRRRNLDFGVSGSSAGFTRRRNTTAMIAARNAAAALAQ
jgi:hypothetical protein